MKSNMPIEEVSPLVQEWMPDATDEDHKRATVRLRNYLAVVYRLFERLEAEERLSEARDKSERYVRVDASNHDST